MDEFRRLGSHLGKRVGTPLGDGWLWQVFLGRVAVVLEVKPGVVIFLEDSSRIHPLAAGLPAPWLASKSRKRPGPTPSFLGEG